jgi:hypothetical protein
MLHFRVMMLGLGAIPNPRVRGPQRVSNLVIAGEHGSGLRERLQGLARLAVAEQEPAQFTQHATALLRR